MTFEDQFPISTKSHGMGNPGNGDRTLRSFGHRETGIVLFDDFPDGLFTTALNFGGDNLESLITVFFVHLN